MHYAKKWPDFERLIGRERTMLYLAISCHGRQFFPLDRLSGQYSNCFQAKRLFWLKLHASCRVSMRPGLSLDRTQYFPCLLRLLEFSHYLWARLDRKSSFGEQYTHHWEAWLLASLSPGFSKESSGSTHVLNYRHVAPLLHPLPLLSPSIFHSTKVYRRYLQRAKCRFLCHMRIITTSYWFCLLWLWNKDCL